MTDAGAQRPAPAAERGLYVLGAGWFAIEVAGWAEDSGWRVVGLVEMLDPSRVGTVHGGYRVVDADELTREHLAVAAGGGDRREHWVRCAASGCSAATIVHPTAHLAASATVAPGAIIAPAVVIGAETAVHEHALISRGALVGHHVTIGSFARLLPGANVAGHVRIDSDVCVGMAAAIVDHTHVAAGAIVAAGAVVLRDVPAGTRVQGVPARVFT